jgi:flagellar FliL protein
MKKLVMALIALLMLGGGGAGAYFYFQNPAEAASKEEAPAKDEHAKDGEHGGHFEYVEMAPLILPIIDEYGVTQTVSLVVSLEVKDAHAAETVKKYQPRLTDAYLQDMYGMLNHYAVAQSGMIKVDKLKERLNKVSTKVLGEDVVNDVLLQVLNQRPI